MKRSGCVVWGRVLRRAELCDSVFVGPYDDLKPTREVEFEQDVTEVSFDRRGGNVRQGRDFVIGSAKSYKPDDLHFALREEGKRCGPPRSHKLLEKARGRPRRERGIADSNSTNGGREQLRGLIFQCESTGASPNRSKYIIVEIKGCHYKNAGWSPRSEFDASGRFDAVEPGHPHIQDDNIGIQAQASFYRRWSVRRDGYDSDIRFQLEDGSEILTYSQVIVGHDN
jgi:hypothetical protein